ncbi:AraC family transcriptional regulator [Paenibacillus sp. LHD-117]|uniref:AraC family transcriptional regulator n=1 Tax=Paenibacillus sp. LHD-117 TaxID=3071412 RepID=UPI0027E077F0|nr:AraC family transcriptional regulator [Paenibacillus sp. LHD-117]MDQ6419567.1 AraC family transcriptional regulator [Paenibacillus sp. LHD-117]
MNWGRGNFTRSVAFRWIVSYAVILFIPVIVSVIIYSQTREIVKYEIERASRAMLQQVRYIVDGELHQTESLAAQLSIHPDVRKFLSSPSEESAYHIYRTKQELNKQLATNDFIKEIYLHSNSLHSVLSGETYVQDRMFYDMKHHTDTFAYEDWVKLVTESQPGRYILLPVENQGRIEMTPSYIRSLPMQAGADPAGTLLIPLNAEKIKTMLENIDWVEQGQVFIMDANDQILFQNGGDAENMPTDSMITIESSDTTGWKYVSVFPTDVFWERARAIQTMNLFGLLLCFAIGGAVIYYFSRKNYDPVKQLVSVFSRGQSQGTGADTDEYSFIRRSVLETIRERDDMNNKQVQQLRVLRNYYLARLLKGQADRNVPLAELSKAHHLSWASDRFAVLLFYIDSEESDDRILDMSPFIVSNILADSVGDRLTIHFADVDGTLAAVVNIAPDREEQWKDDMEDALAQAYEFIEARYKLRFTAAGSELQTGLDGVHQAFLQALEAQEYRMVLGEGMLIWYGDVKPTESSYFFTVNDQMILINLMKADEFEKAKLMIGNVVDQAFKRQSSLEIAKCVLLDVATTLIKTIPDQEQASIAWDDRRPLKRLLSCSTKAEFRQELLDVWELVSEVLRSKQGAQTNAGLGEKVIQFVQEHYGDKNLSVAMIGDRFRLSPQYVSRLFREQTGQGLHDFISQTRVEAAKTLLQDGASIDETAAGVGFASGHAFIRVFKKYEGITPGKYKTIQ